MEKKILQQQKENAFGDRDFGPLSQTIQPPHMIIREFPTLMNGSKSAFKHAYGENQHDKFSHHQASNETSVASVTSQRDFSFTSNAHSYRQFINQLGTIRYDKPDGDSDAPNYLGLNNPGLVLDDENPSNNEMFISRNQPFSPSSASTTSTKSMNSYNNTLYMDDNNTKRIDMVLVFEDDLDFNKEHRRKTFLHNLEDEGLEIQMENPDPNRRFNQETRTHFVKVHAPWNVLTKYAEIMNMKMPIKKLISISYKTLDKNHHGTDKVSWWKKRKPWLGVFEYNHERIPAAPSFFMASFNRHKEECFIIKDRETFFTPAQRAQIVWKIMTRVKFTDADIDKTGIRRLLNDKTFTAAFPLHDGPYDRPEDDHIGQNDRRLLYTEWAHYTNWYKKQPLWLIRRYFGDKVGLYFAWLGFYTGMLIPASIVGILCFLFGLTTMDTDYNTPSREICNNEISKELIMCPLCGHCELWHLNDSCTFSQLTYLFDNPATVFFAIFMAFWATSFLEFWKRKHSVIAWEWDLNNFEVEQEPRPEFEAAVKTFRINPVTQTSEPYLSFWNKTLRMLAVSSIVILLLFIVAFVVVGIIVVRLVMMTLLYTDTNDLDDTPEMEKKIELFRDNAKIIASVSAAIINLVIVVFLHNRVYFNVAIWLTNSEYPRTQTEYEDSFTFKMFLFQFINYYSYLIYIAFFKGRFFRHPGDDSENSFEKIRGDMCDPAGCLSELFIQLSIIMIGKQFINNFVELLMPKVSNWCRRIRYTSAVDSNAPIFLTRWEQDYNLKKVDQLALFHEYLEMVIQYGFVTLFVAAFPLAPFFAFVNNVMEIRLDAYKWTTQLRRPLAERVEDIGAWYGILQGITYTSVVTNAFVIAYTSDMIPRLVYKYTNDAGTLEGYINSSLSYFPTANYLQDNQKIFDGRPYEFCRYRGYYDLPANNGTEFEPSPRYWHIMAARLAFVAVFEHLAFALTGVMAFAIPDVPREISVQIQREKLLASEALYESDLARLQREKDNHHSETSTKDAKRGSIIAQDLLSQMAKKEKVLEIRNGAL